MNEIVGAIHESPGKTMININKILINIWLAGLFISPVFGQDFGSAVITSVPDSADVYVDGYHFGKTPFNPVMIIPGTYALKLKHKGYDSLLTSMNIESGKRLVKKVILKMKTDSLNADSIADIQLNKPQPCEFCGHVEEDENVPELSVTPTLIDSQKTYYPRLAREKGLEGKVYLKLLIDLDGTIVDGAIAKSSGAFCLDYEAIKSGYSLKSTHAIGKDNKPVRVWIVWPVKFFLKK